jgi:hypothetical protein
MKKLILLFVLVSTNANAYCYCTCQNGQSVKVCTQPMESNTGPICSPYC